jgi:hypothetical protein
MNRYEKDDAFELVQAAGEHMYSHMKVKEVHDHLVDEIPLMTIDDLTSFIALIECEMNERDKYYDQLLTDCPF